MRRIQVTITGEVAAKGTACHLISFGVPFEIKKQEGGSGEDRWTFDAPAEFVDMFGVPGSNVKIVDIDPSAEALSTVRQAAVDQYATDDIEIDGISRFSRGEDGTWVSAWVWVSDEEVAGDDEDEEEEDDEAGDDICSRCENHLQPGESEMCQACLNILGVSDGQ